MSLREKIGSRTIITILIAILLSAITLISTFYLNIKNDNEVLREEINILLKDTVSHEDKEFLSSIKITNIVDSQGILCGQKNIISGTYSNTYFTPKWDVFLVVKAPDEHYYPNKKIDLVTSDSTWSSSVWIGSPNNSSGEEFRIFLIAVRPGLSREFAKIEGTNGKEDLGRNLPPGVQRLQSLMVKCK
jgi:hypothetical protein